MYVENKLLLIKNVIKNKLDVKNYNKNNLL